MEGSKFSLSFSKVIEKKILQPSALKPIREKPKESQEEIIESIEENVIKSNAAQEQELVIPLLQRDLDHPILAKAKQKTKLPEQDNKNSRNHDDSHRVLTLEEEAEQALLAEVADPNLRVQHASSDVSIPKQDERKTSTTLGSVPTLDDFEEVGVDNFGAAMLRGMGWKKGEGVGNARNRKVVSIIEASNKTLGSSIASRSKTALHDQQGSQEGEEQLTLKKGTYALISAGRHKGSYGIVESVEEDHVLLRKAVGGAVVREVEANLTLVTKEHYSDSSRVINKEMFDKFKDSELNKNKKSSDSSKKKYDSGSDEESRERKDKRSDKGRRPDETSASHESSSHKSSLKSNNLLPVKSEREINHGNKPVAAVKELKTEEFRACIIKNDPTNVSEISSLDSNCDAKISEVKNEHQKLLEAVQSRKVKRDLDCSHSNFMTLDQKEKDSSRRSEGFATAGTKRHHGISLSSDEEKKPNKKAFLEIEKSSRSSKSENHFRARDRSKPSRKEVQSKEQYLLSRYGDASVKAGEDLTSGAARSAPWVREGLTVRITCEKFKRGKYFKEKVVVENVATAVQCECRTSEGKLLSHVPPDILETVIPKLPPRTVMVVKGRHTGMLGRVLEQHKSSQEASVQLLEDRSQILRLQYEQICQYSP